MRSKSDRRKWDRPTSFSPSVTEGMWHCLFLFDFLFTDFDFCRAVPQAAEFLDPPTLSKGKTEKTKKKKESAKEKSPGVVDMTGFTALPPSRPLSASGSPAPGQLRNSQSPAPSMMKSSFSRVTEDTSERSTPVPSERTKFAFGFGVKRKLGEEGVDTPPLKKR